MSIILFSLFLIASTKANVIQVTTHHDLEQLQGIRVLNASLIINNTNMTASDLCHLSDLEVIQGQLIIEHNHQLESLYCLRNLKDVIGDYPVDSNPNAIDISHNFDIETNTGLCYVDTIDWSQLTTGSVTIHQNKPDCSEKCDKECVGCWGAGPRVCQNCQSTLSGETCVDICPIGAKHYPYGRTENDRRTCEELKYPGKPHISAVILDNTSIEIIWTATASFGAVPLGFEIFMNDTSLIRQVYPDVTGESNGIDEPESLSNSFHVYNLTEGTLYGFQISLLAHGGWSPKSDIDYEVTHPAQLSDPIGVTIEGVSPRTSIISWKPPHHQPDPIAYYHVFVEKYGYYWNDVNRLKRGYVSVFYEMVNASVHQVSVTPLYYGIITYRAAVVAETESGDMSLTYWYEFQQLNPEPPDVINARCDYISDTHIRLKWEAKERDESEINQWNQNFVTDMIYAINGVWLDFAVYNITTFEYDIRGLNASTDYVFLIIFRSSYGAYGAWNWIECTTLNESITTDTTTPTTTLTTTPTSTQTTTPTSTQTTTPTLTRTTSQTSTPTSTPTTTLALISDFKVEHPWVKYGFKLMYSGGSDCSLYGCQTGKRFPTGRNNTHTLAVFTDISISSCFETCQKTQICEGIYLVSLPDNRTRCRLLDHIGNDSRETTENSWSFVKLQNNKDETTPTSTPTTIPKSSNYIPISSPNKIANPDTSLSTSNPILDSTSNPILDSTSNPDTSLSTSNPILDLTSNPVLDPVLDSTASLDTTDASVNDTGLSQTDEIADAKGKNHTQSIVIGVVTVIVLCLIAIVIGLVHNYRKTRQLERSIRIGTPNSVSFQNPLYDTSNGRTTDNPLYAENQEFNNVQLYNDYTPNNINDAENDINANYITLDSLDNIEDEES